MLKYIDTLVTFTEIPDEITLCINLSNCPHRCKGCHSPGLQKDEGTLLTDDELAKLINQNYGITCVCFMGGDADIEGLNRASNFICNFFNNNNTPNELIKTAGYSGYTMCPTELISWNFNYIKLGHYIEECGPLNNPNTNQKLYMQDRHAQLVGWPSLLDDRNSFFGWTDITYKFGKDESADS